MKKFFRVNNGVTEYFSGVLKTGDVQIINPTEEQLIDAGWQEYIPPVTSTPAETVEDVRFRKLQEIEDYDNSEQVNTCYIEYQGNTISYWADKAARTALKEAVRDCMDSGIDNYRLDLRDYSVSISIECYKMLDMLQQLEIYAIQCYNKTTDHIYAVQALETKEEIEDYVYMTGYPEKITFNI